jgi:general secretion pathway protein G
LLELLVVLAILALIAAFAGPRVFSFLSGAKTDAAKVQIENLATTLDIYRLELGSYPTEDQGLRALIERPAGVENWNGPYLNKAEGLTDPWGNPYRYRIPPENGVDYDLFTLGADNSEGGDSENRDIGNW